MATLLRQPHRMLRHSLGSIERVLIGAGITALLYNLFNVLPVYPVNWDTVILVAVFITALFSPIGVYFFAVIVALYPLYTLSLYIAVLFLAIALLGQYIFVRNLGATVLVLVTATPLLGQYQLAWMVPLLGGLWWGKSGGIWMGLSAALTGQIIAGMAGQSPDWLNLLSTSPQIYEIAQYFEHADSLETLEKILAPLAPNSTTLLYHLLQVVIWASVGGIVGGVAQWDWTIKKSPWSKVLIASIGAFSMTGLHIGLGLWLDKYTLQSFTLWTLLLETTLVAAAIVGILVIVLDFLEHPLPPSIPSTISKEPIKPETKYPPLEIHHKKHQKRTENQDDNQGLIKLELD